MQTLLELLPKMQALGAREALRYHNGYRTWNVSYLELLQRISRFAHYLKQRGLHKGDRLLLWGENRPEWVYVFWSCLARGVEVVPLDFRFSPQLVQRIQQEVAAKLLVTGDEVNAASVDVERISYATVTEITTNAIGANSALEGATISADDVVEIVYTSGTTGDPKGVVHRHRNIASNLTGIQNEIDRYRLLMRPFQPIRLLDLLPLSHLFGQSTGLFVPVMLEGAVVFTSDTSPGALLETIRRERVSVLIGVPRMLANLRQDVERKLPAPARKPKLKGLAAALESWLRYRAIHSRVGWKFWALVVGGAPLSRELEDFWRWLGFVVVQGYGLTEASPVIAVNHPFHARRGSIGSALAGQEVKLAPDGEILVRGPSVVNEYFSRSAVASETSAATRIEEPRRNDESRNESEDGWLHTGDIAEMDAEGHLFYRGRKKEMIARPDGMNVYPQDVEAVLNSIPGVKECAVVGVERNGEERVHAAVILEDSGPDAQRRLDALVRQANNQLETHQRIQGWSLWIEEDFPRTGSTMKIRHAEVARRMAAETSGTRSPGTNAEEHPTRAGADSQGVSGVKNILAEMTGRDAAEVHDDLRLEEDLGLSSLERVELMARLENRYNVELDEESFAAISEVADLERWLRENLEPSPQKIIQSGHAPGPVSPAIEIPRSLEAPTPESPAKQHSHDSQTSPLITQPRWTRSLPVRFSRAVLLDAAILPMVRELVRLKVAGLENLDGIKPPVIFAANHTSHFDTAVIYASLPRRWRRRLAPAMSQDFFRPLFEPRYFSREQFWNAAGQYLLACGLFNAYPLPQKMGGARRALRYTGELIDRGYYPLVFPEGKRSETGEMLSFKTGIGLMARRLSVPVIPIHLDGVYQVYSVHHEWPQPGRVVARFGPPLRFEPSGDYLEAARAIEQAVRKLAAD